MKGSFLKGSSPLGRKNEIGGLKEEGKQNDPYLSSPIF